MVYKIYPEVEANLSHNISRFAEAGELYRQAVEMQKKKLLEVKAGEVHIPILKLKKVTPLHTILFEVLNEYNFTPHQVNEVLHLMEAGQGSYIQSPSHRIIKNRNWLIIARKNNETAVHIVINDSDREVTFSGGFLKIEKEDGNSFNIVNDPHVAELDQRHIKFPLLLRKWKAGDYFYPLGMRKKKKVSRFLIDSKLSRTEKEKTYVIESGKKICWVVGMRIDERFKITASTKQKLKMKIS